MDGCIVCLKRQEECPADTTCGAFLVMKGYDDMTAKKLLVRKRAANACKPALDAPSDTDKYIKAASLISQALNVLNSNLVRL